MEYYYIIEHKQTHEKYALSRSAYRKLTSSDDIYFGFNKKISSKEILDQFKIVDKVYSEKPPYPLFKIWLRQNAVSGKAKYMLLTIDDKLYYTPNISNLAIQIRDFINGKVNKVFYHKHDITEFIKNAKIDIVPVSHFYKLSEKIKIEPLRKYLAIKLNLRSPDVEKLFQTFILQSKLTNKIYRVTINFNCHKHLRKQTFEDVFNRFVPKFIKKYVDFNQFSNMFEFVETYFHGQSKIPFHIPLLHDSDEFHALKTSNLYDFRRSLMIHIPHKMYITEWLTTGMMHKFGVVFKYSLSDMTVLRPNNHDFRQINDTEYYMLVGLHKKDLDLTLKYVNPSKQYYVYILFKDDTIRKYVTYVKHLRALYAKHNHEMKTFITFYVAGKFNNLEPIIRKVHQLQETK